MESDKPDQTYDNAAEMFRVMADPTRLKIISCLCDGEQNVSELLSRIGASQSNMSQHLTKLYLAGVLAKRRAGVQIYYRIGNDCISKLCEAVCFDVQKRHPRPYSNL
jgi:ArsR family transcriptional regulator